MCRSCCMGHRSTAELEREKQRCRETEESMLVQRFQQTIKGFNWHPWYLQHTVCIHGTTMYNLWARREQSTEAHLHTVGIQTWIKTHGIQMVLSLMKERDSWTFSNRSSSQMNQNLGNPCQLMVSREERWEKQVTASQLFLELRTWVSISVIHSTCPQKQLTATGKSSSGNSIVLTKLT